MNTGFDFLYSTRRGDREHFGEHWIGPEVFEHFQETLIARYEAESDSDGQTVEVYCEAAPARFYTLKVLSGPNSIGESQNGYEITTGSGQGELVARLAEAIQQGMIGFKDSNDPIK